MTSLYPTSLDSFTDPAAGSYLSTVPHSAIEIAQNQALAALEATVGTTGSAVPSTIFYGLKNPLSLDPGHLHTLSAMVGSLPTSRLTGTIPTSSLSGTFPASSLSGVVPSANLNIGTGAGQILGFTLANIFPAVNASSLTNVPAPDTTSGVSAGPAASATQIITHGLGRIPKTIRIHGIGVFSGGASAANASKSDGTFSGSGNKCIYIVGSPGSTGSSTTPVNTSSFAVYLDTGNGTGGGPTASGVIQNVTLTTFDIVWSLTATTVAAGQFIWEAE